MAAERFYFNTTDSREEFSEISREGAKPRRRYDLRRLAKENLPAPLFGWQDGDVVFG
jgi:hypothetical protein